MILEDREVYERMSNAVNPYGDGTSSERIYDIIRSYYDKNLLGITSFDEIIDFKGYYMRHVTEDVTVESYESLHEGHIIEEIFEDGTPIYIDNNLNLKNKDIVVKEFSKVE